MPEKIAIVGAYRSHKLLAPYADPDWEIWSVSPQNERELPRQDVWFELHRRETLHNVSGQAYLDWVKTLPLVYMQEADPEYPGSVAYPRREMLDTFGGEFFTSSIAWMLALAISRYPEAIGVWGVECAHADEYTSQRTGVMHFLGIARALGIPVTLPDGCRLLTDRRPLYGYEVDV